MCKWLLFQTRAGEWVLAAIERVMGLAVVDVGSLGGKRAGEPLHVERRYRWAR